MLQKMLKNNNSVFKRIIKMCTFFVLYTVNRTLIYFFFVKKAIVRKNKGNF